MSTSAEEKFRSEKEWNWAEKYGSEWFILRWITRPLPKRVMVSISRLVCPLPRLLATSFLRSRHQYLVGVRVDNKCNIGLS
ncbi:hypothetical protein F9C07_6441 [Aspergillus flavus]|uniref:Uncharacterized protein n=1 Tax=Aspergillus flavus (strain ATCC 200026 / FGSC A1120 / IAM 13836 / NRRL 3357 / JCM 12722 / SRRC 167) TaxID=332952 RepID=A0A7U2QT70_ASPFN|nr:hypothetical protein F9C07_6441 [Aspergillus flavus]